MKQRGHGGFGEEGRDVGKRDGLGGWKRRRHRGQRFCGRENAAGGGEKDRLAGIAINGGIDDVSSDGDHGTDQM